MNDIQSLQYGLKKGPESCLKSYITVLNKLLEDAGCWDIQWSHMKDFTNGYRKINAIQEPCTGACAVREENTGKGKTAIRIGDGLKIEPLLPRDLQ